MAKTSFTSVDEYIASQPEAVQRTLELVRSAIRNAVPEAEERISYDMPSYKLHGESLCQFAGWKQHYSLYFSSQGVVAAFNDELAAYNVKKGTISFPLAKPVPVKLIERIAKFRANQIAERERERTRRRA